MFGAISFGAVLPNIVIIYAVVTYRGSDAAKGKGTKEGFVVNPLDPTGERAKEFALKIPPLGGGPKPTSLPVSRDVTGVLPSELPGPLPIAPYQAIARNAPYPYNDPSLVKTNRARILEVLERLKGFLAFQAPEIEDRSDPSIQLPLNTARADFKHLESEANVLQRNPGIQPDITDLQMNEIEANLAYLQRETEQIGVNRPFQSPVHDIDLLHGGTLHSNEGFQNPDNSIVGTHDPATLEDLQEFSSRAQGEILRLSASGTTDPVITARVGNLTRMRGEVDSVIQRLQSGALLSVEVPIMKSDIDKALPILGDPSQPLPQLLRSMNLPAGLANMLPAGVTKDAETRRQVGNLLERYTQSFLEGASAAATFTVNYVSPRQVAIAKARQPINVDMEIDIEGDMGNGGNGSTIAQTGFPSAADLDRVGSDPSLTAIDAPDRVTDVHAADPRAEGRTPLTGDKGPSHYDWRARSAFIVSQIKKRGMDPKDFGALATGSAVGPTFSWRGYTKMICSRLQTVDAFKMDEMCGCPPADWTGWNA